ncbi:MAG TPA: hypothetical protein PKC43_03090 [Phycisphaerales bacterium]|nr:hypothetical protein [Phycisphaerales bacterium]HMP36413.1 hypothetical protein [Phycisphaerales bacterium]
MRCRATSLVGLLVTMAIIVVLAAVLLTSLNVAVTGAGQTTSGSVRSFADSMNLRSLFTGMAATGLEGVGSMGATGGARPQGSSGYPIPSVVDGRARRELDTTASIYSLLVMRDAVAPKSLISANERNPVVDVAADYRWHLYNPAGGVHWDPGFVADLERGSNVSYAHLPFWGRRFDEHWARISLDSRMPLIGSRGPRDGRVEGTSFTLGRDGTWAGHLLFADGHVEWVDSVFAPGRRVGEGHDARPDGLFTVDDGPLGGDAFLGFVSGMDPSGPRIQWD